MVEKRSGESFERKLRKAIKLNPIKKDELVLVEDKIVEFCLKKAVKGLPHKVVKSGKYDKRVVLWTLDDEDRELLHCVLNKKKLKKDDSKVIKLFKFVSDEELLQYAKANKISLKIKKDEIKDLVAKLSEKYPQTRYSLLKSSDEIKKLIDQ
jgi:hypothetical protein